MIESTPQATAHRISPRTIIEGLILAGIIAVIATQIQIIKQMAAFNERITYATLQTSDIPNLRDRVSHVESTQQELIRRQNADDDRHARMDRPEPRN